MDIDKAAEESGRDSNAWLVRVAADLAVYIEDQEQTWGDTDDVLLARYDAGMCTPEERLKVEQAMRDFPAVRESTEILRKLGAEWETVFAPEAAEMLLPAGPEHLTQPRPHVLEPPFEGGGILSIPSPTKTRPIHGQVPVWQPLFAAFRATTTTVRSALWAPIHMCAQRLAVTASGLSSCYAMIMGKRFGEAGGNMETAQNSRSQSPRMSAAGRAESSEPFAHLLVPRIDPDAYCVLLILSKTKESDVSATHLLDAMRDDYRKNKRLVGFYSLMEHLETMELVTKRSTTQMLSGQVIDEHFYRLTSLGEALCAETAEILARRYEAGLPRLVGYA